MGRKFLTALAAAAALLAAAAPAARADLMIRQRTSDQPGTETTLYLKGSLQRREFNSPQRDGRILKWAYIDDCARQQFTWLDLINRRYTIHTGGVPIAVIAAFNEQQFPPFVPRKAKGAIEEIITITDTGERREMFGFNARRLKTVTTWAAAPESCDAGRARTETDGWYVDLLHGVDCSPDLSGAVPHSLVEFAGSACLNKRLRGKYFFRRRYEGGARLGFPVYETARSDDGRGRVTTRTQEVLELSTARLDDALFGVPAGYERVEPRYVGKPSALSRVLSIFR